MRAVATGVKLLRLCYFVAELALERVVAVDEILRECGAISVENPFIADTAHRHVAVFVLRRIVRVFAVFTLGVVNREPRHRQAEIVPLLEERPSKIEVASIREGIVFVAPPPALFVDLIGFLR